MTYVRPDLCGGVWTSPDGVEFVCTRMSGDDAIMERDLPDRTKTRRVSRADLATWTWRA